jgi:hypothetical protein
MRVAQIILSVLSTLMVGFSLICGLWIRNMGGKITDLASSTRFHMMLGIITAVCVLAATVITLIRK